MKKLVTRRKVIVSGVMATITAATVSLRGALGGAASLPDMIVTAVLVPVANVGDAVNFKAAVKNNGAGSTPSGVELGVAFRVDGKEVCWSGKDRAALAPGASIALFSDSGGPAGNGTWIATVGNHTLEAVVNDVHRFPESNTGNNALTVNFTIPASGKPVNVTLPVITGTAQVGNSLAVSNGTWS